MKRNYIFAFFVFLIFCAGIIGCVPRKNIFEKGVVPKAFIGAVKENHIEEKNDSMGQYGNGVLAHGELKAVNGKIIDKNGNNFVLKGMSSHGIVWFPEFTNKHTIQMTKDNGANVFRIAMYTEEYGGYTTGENEKLNAKKIMYNAVENTISLDMYAIIDWHILSDSNPQKHKNEAVNFFDEVSKKYADNPAVIYEICNEPHGVSWKNDIKPYAQEIVSVIRKNSPNALIIVGTNTWSQDVDEASEDLLDFENIAYALHFYSGTHKLDNFKPKIEKAMENGATVFVSEWGTSDASGNNGNYFDEASKWLSYLDEKEISRINWSLCAKEESSAALLSGVNPESWSEKDLSQSGKFVFEKLKEDLK